MLRRTFLPAPSSRGGSVLPLLPLCSLLALLPSFGLQGCSDEVGADPAGESAVTGEDGGGEGDEAEGNDAASPDDGGLTDAGVDASRGSSHGSGGVTCSSKENLGSGLEACVATAGGAEFKAFVPTIGSGPYRLAVYLHGDGARAYKSNSALKSLATWAQEHRALLVAVRAPNTCAWWLAPSVVCDSDGNAQSSTEDTQYENASALDAVFKALRAGYDVADSPLFYYGSSGGSIFLSKRFFPKYGATYPGIYAMNCGGEVPDQAAFTWSLDDANLRGTTRFSFTYGSLDPLAEDTHATYLYTKGKSFPSDETIVPDAGHCEFDAHGRAREVWTAADP